MSGEVVDCHRTATTSRRARLRRRASHPSVADPTRSTKHPTRCPAQDEDPRDRVCGTRADEVAVTALRPSRTSSAASGTARGLPAF